MKILHVIASVAPRYGGPSKMVLELCKALGDRNHEVYIFTTNIDGDKNLDVPVDQYIQMDGFTIRYFPVQSPRRFTFSLPIFKAFKKKIYNFDIVHIHSLYLFHNLIAGYYCRKYHIPYLIRPHGILDPFLQKRHPVRKKVYNFLIEKRNLNNASAIHYTTNEEMELAKPLNIKASSIVVPNGLDISAFSKLPAYGSFKRKYPALENKKIILFFSRINFKKGMDILVKAFGKVTRARDDIYLVVVGPDNEGYGKKVNKWLEDEGVLNKTLFTGMLLGEEKMAVLTDSDLFVLPSYSENFGIVVAEAMACGLPVVISNKVNIWQEVKQAGAGIVTDCDSDQVADAILKILDDPTRAKEMGEKGKQLVKSQYAWDQVAEKMIETYQNIITEHQKKNDNS